MRLFNLVFLSSFLFSIPAHAVIATLVSQDSGITAPGNIVVNYGQGGTNHTIPYARLTGSSCSQKAEQLEVVLQKSQDIRVPKASIQPDDPDHYEELLKSVNPGRFDSLEDGTVDADPAQNLWITDRGAVWTIACDATNSNFIITISNP